MIAFANVTIFAHVERLDVMTTAPIAIGDVKAELDLGLDGAQSRARRLMSSGSMLLKGASIGGRIWVPDGANLSNSHNNSH